MDMEKIMKLRRLLHEHPEPSMQERETKRILMDFLRQNTGLDIADRGSWFYAVKKGSGDRPPIAFRADFDAVVCGDGQARHLCGHDGHSAVLAGLAASLPQTDRDIYLIFQPGEETGRGGRICADLLTEKQIGEVYGFHNIPGAVTGTVLLPEGTFACASVGLVIDLAGKPAHAAYPEQGISPGPAIADLLRYAEECAKKEHHGVLLATLIGIDAGSRSFGLSADSAQLRFTLRAEFQDLFNALVRGMEDRAYELAGQYGLTCRVSRTEEFPATVSHPECVLKLRKAAEALNLRVEVPPEPFRWSEDFGYYLQKTKGAFFGIGCGKAHPGLHTAEYEFNDGIIPTAIDLFRSLC